MNMKIALFLSAALAGIAVNTAAKADGFGAALLRDTGLINEDQRRALDGLNKQLGQPVDHAATALMDIAAPGSGTAVEAYWQGQRVLNGTQDQMSNGMQQPVPNQMQQQGQFQPPIQQQTQFQQPQQVQYQPRFGQFCNINGMMFGPGPVNQVGAPCWVVSPNGPVWGQIN